VRFGAARRVPSVAVPFSRIRPTIWGATTSRSRECRRGQYLQGCVQREDRHQTARDAPCPRLHPMVCESAQSELHALTPVRSVALPDWRRELEYVEHASREVGERHAVRRSRTASRSRAAAQEQEVRQIAQLHEEEAMATVTTGTHIQEQFRAVAPSPDGECDRSVTAVGTAATAMIAESRRIGRSEAIPEDEAADEHGRFGDARHQPFFERRTCNREQEEVAERCSAGCSDARLALTKAINPIANASRYFRTPRAVRRSAEREACTEAAFCPRSGQIGFRRQRILLWFCILTQLSGNEAPFVAAARGPPGIGRCSQQSTCAYRRRPAHQRSKILRRG